jgi:hypothetical protein
LIARNNAQDYLEFSQCRAVLATKLPAWNLGDIAPANSVGGKDVIERMRRYCGNAVISCHPLSLNCLSL